MSDKIVVQIDGQEKQFTVDELKDQFVNLSKQQAAATQLSQEYAPLKKLCEQYNAKPADVAVQADALFKKVTSWQQDGILDDNFEIADRKKPSKQSHDDDDTDLDGLLHKKHPGSNFSKDDVSAIAQQAVENARAPLNQKIERLERGIEMLSNFHIEAKLREKYPDLEGEDIARAIQLARSDSSKNLIQHAEDIANFKKTRVGEMEKQFAQKYGVDIDKYNENKLNQQAAEGGALPIFKGKRIVLSNRRSGEDTVSARDAMVAHLKAKAEAAV